MVITMEQVQFLKKHITGIEGLLSSNDINSLLLAIDNAILHTLSADGNPNHTGVELQELYDILYESN